MRYPESFVERLRQTTTISAVIGKRINVTRAGREFKACCPFHNEKTPSFTINDAKGFYHCFGCGVHGDAIGFIAEYEKIGYREAIEQLANESGIALPQPDVQEQKREKRRLDLQQINELACRWFEAQLQSTQGHAARSYLQQRGLNDETIAHFRIGYAPDDRQALTKALADRGAETKDMIAAGLLSTNDRNEHYSRFRGRIIFPITTVRDQVIAFGGRILDANNNPNAPKYLNSPETELFHKGEQLYHFGGARRAAHDMPLVICEGYMDVIALHQAGHVAAVAPLGTAVTESQLRMCWSVSDTPVLALDGDSAGLRAMQRAADVALPLLQPGKSLKILTLPEGDDPDTLVRTSGLAVWKQMLEQAQDLSGLLWQRLRALPSDTPAARAAQDQEAHRLTAQIAHSGVQQHYQGFFKERFYDARRIESPQRHKRGKPTPTALPPLPDPADSRAMQERIAMHLLGLICLEPALLERADSELLLSCAPLRGVWRTIAENLLLNQQANPETADAFQQRLREQAGEQAWEQFAKRYVPRHTVTDESHVTLLYEQLVQRWQHRAMMEDFKSFQKEYAGRMSDEAFKRMKALMMQTRSGELAAGALPETWMQD